MQIRPYRPGDEAGILRTFNLVFREVCGEGFEERTIDHWRWQFLENPAGIRTHVALAGDGVVAAQYAAIPVVVDTVEGEQVFVQAVDSMTHPAHRQGLKRRGLFSRTFDAWVESCIAEGVAVGYGYPVRAAERIGRRFLGYEVLRVVDFLCRGLGPGPGAPAGVEVSEVARPSADVDLLYESVRRRIPCLTRRDLRYMGWRFAARPDRPYAILEARKAAALTGVMVLSPLHELVPGSCTIADWLVPGDDEETADALIDAALRRARQMARKRLLAVFAEPSAEHRAFLRRGFEVVPSAETLERRLIYRIFNPPLTGQWLRENWWYTLGDSDLV